MSNRKVDYTSLEREYVFGEVSQRELAKREGISNGTLSEYARNHEWDSKRDNYRNKLAVRVTDKTVEKVADEQAKVNDEIFKAMRATIYKYVEGLQAGHIVPSTKDAVMASEVIRSLFGEPDKRLEVRSFNVTATGQLGDPEFLRRLEQLTRGVRDGDEPAGGARLRIEGPRPN
jgi:transcriptional regulator with XRE-family HTH domain